MKTGIIFNIQHFSIHDGPGVRTTVFLKGCNLRCWWCHNPESWEKKPTLFFHQKSCIGCFACAESCPQAEHEKTARFTDRCLLCGRCAESCYADALSIMGKNVSTDEIIREIQKDQSVYQRSRGGVTFSGGEPLLQADFLQEVLPRLKAMGIHTAMESALHAPWKTIDSLIPHLDYLMADIKCMDSACHQAHTGVGNEQILSNIQRLAQTDLPLLLRTPIIPGVNDDEESIIAISRFIRGLGRKITWELLPFHGMCNEKYISMNRIYPGKDLQPPDARRMDALVHLARQQGIHATHQ